MERMDVAAKIRELGENRMVECRNRNHFRPNWRYFWHSSHSSQGTVTTVNLLVSYRQPVYEKTGLETVFLAQNRDRLQEGFF